MTNQTAQAATGALQATGLLIGSIQFTILMVTAVALSPLAALIVMVVAVALFGVFRPLRALGARHARDLSAAQVRYAGGIAEANRLAEESQVFGVTREQNRRVMGFVMACRSLFYKSQVMIRLVPNLYQTLIFLVLILGLEALHRYGVGNVGSLGAVVLLFVRASQAGQQTQSFYQALQQTLPFLDRLRAAEARYAASAARDGGQRLDTIKTVAFEKVSFAYVPGQAVLEDVSFTVAAGEAIGIVGPSGAGKSTLVQVLLQLPAAKRGPVPDQRRGRRRVCAGGLDAPDRLRAAGTAPAARVGRRQRALLPRPRRRCGRARLPARAHRRGHRVLARRTTSGSSGPARTRSPAASSSACAWRARSPPIPRCSCSTSPRARWTRIPSRSSRSRSPRSRASSRCSRSRTACRRSTCAIA